MIRRENTTSILKNNVKRLLNIKKLKLKKNNRNRKKISNKRKKKLKKRRESKRSMNRRNVQLLHIKKKSKLLRKCLLMLIWMTLNQMKKITKTIKHKIKITLKMNILMTSMVLKVMPVNIWTK